MAGRPKGSPNKEDSKPWRDALKVAAKRDPQRLANLAEKTFDMAIGGDMAAIKEIGDRLDGRPVTPTENKHHVEGTINVITGVPSRGDD